MTQSEAPDKILYNHALTDYQHGRYIESRLELQTLINSYPDSEYLAKAKLAIADSFYKQGGVEALTQAVQAYKDFITFFPFLSGEAAYAQMQVGMSHYRMMEKPDRDETQARLAEVEFQTFLLTYPKSPLVPQAEQDLRDVQEVLAQGDYDVARFYYIKGDYRAAAARLLEVTKRYPLFSRSDHAVWMMADIYQRAAKGSKNEKAKAFWRSEADKEYAKLVREYPLSSYVAQAKHRLREDGEEIPAPNRVALARERYDEKYTREHEGILHHVLGMIKSSPDVAVAARSGAPDLNPPGEIASPQTVLAAKAQPKGPRSESAGEGTSPASAGQNVGVGTVTPGDTPAESPAAESSTPPADNRPAADSTTASPQNAAPDASAPTPGANRPAPTPDKPAHGAKHKSKPKAPKLNKKKESSSKRKKGLRKLIPW